MTLTKIDKDNDNIEDLEFEFDKECKNFLCKNDKYYYEFKCYNKENTLIETILCPILQVNIYNNSIRMNNINIKQYHGYSHIIIEKIIVKNQTKKSIKEELKLNQCIMYTLY